MASGTGGDGGGALADERAGVGHRPHDRSPGSGGLERGEGDPGRDRQDEGALGEDLGAAA